MPPGIEEWAPLTSRTGGWLPLGAGLCRAFRDGRRRRPQHATHRRGRRTVAILRAATVHVQRRGHRVTCCTSQAIKGLPRRRCQLPRAWAAARPHGVVRTRVESQTHTENPRNRSVVLSRHREACRDQVGVPPLDVVVPCLPHLLLEVELVAWDRRRSLPGPARPKENDRSPAPMQLGEASRSGFVFVGRAGRECWSWRARGSPFRPVIPRRIDRFGRGSAT
jgi:hypothetical protein